MDDGSGGGRGGAPRRSATEFTLALADTTADAEAASFRWGTTSAAGVEEEDKGEARREPANALLAASSSCSLSNRRNRRRPSSVEGEAADAGTEGAVIGDFTVGCDTDADEEEADAAAYARASLEDVSLRLALFVVVAEGAPLLALLWLFGGSAPRRRGRGGSPSDGDEGEEGDEDVAITTPILLLPPPFEMIGALRPLAGVRCSVASGEAVVDRCPAAVNVVVTECRSPSSLSGPAPCPPKVATGELLLPPTTFRRSPAASEETEPSLRSSLTFIGVGGAVAASIRTLPSKVPPPVFIAAVGRCCGGSKGAKVSGAAEDGALTAASAGTVAALGAVLCLLLLLLMPVVAPPACVAWRSSPALFVFAALSVRRANGF